MISARYDCRGQFGARGHLSTGGGCRDLRHSDTAIQRADRLIISAVNVYETGMVMRARRGAAAERLVWRFLREDNDFEIAPFDAEQVQAALVAFGRYGKGIDPRARLNLADCAAYALATTLDAPLLFKGDDFSATDVKLYI